MNALIAKIVCRLTGAVRLELLRIQPCQEFHFRCEICGWAFDCHHRDLDFRGGVICDDCAEHARTAEIWLRKTHMAPPLDRALDVL